MKRGHILLLVALLGIPTLCSICLKDENPWRCFVAFEREDVLRPVSSGASRTERMAALTSARDVLAFCLEWRKVDCADRMIGRGWSRDDLMAALEN
jgi:hypothetical protein